MHVRLWFTHALAIFLFLSQTTVGQIFRLPITRGFLLYRTNSITQKPCTCTTTFSCSCCETVTLIYSKQQRTLCSNFMYQRNGLNVDISLNKDIVKATTVSIYRPFKLCSAIPGSLFSSICVNVLELNQFPRSLTVCVRHEIVSKSDEWRIDYTCVSISTLLPVVMTNDKTTNGTISMTTAMVTPMTVKASSEMITMATAATPLKTSAPTGSPQSSQSARPPAGQMSTKLSGQLNSGVGGTASMTAIVGLRRKRRASSLKLYKSNTMNRNDHRGGKIINEKIAVTDLRSEDSFAIVNPKPLAVISNLPVNLMTSGVASFANDGLSINNEYRPNVTGKSKESPNVLGTGMYHNITQYFPSRIPPLFAQGVYDNSNLLRVTNVNITDSLIFPN